MLTMSGWGVAALGVCSDILAHERLTPRRNCYQCHPTHEWDCDPVDTSRVGCVTADCMRDLSWSRPPRRTKLSALEGHFSKDMLIHTYGGAVHEDKLSGDD